MASKFWCSALFVFLFVWVLSVCLSLCLGFVCLFVYLFETPAMASKCWQSGLPGGQGKETRARYCCDPEKII